MQTANSPAPPPPPPPPPPPLSTLPSAGTLKLSPSNPSSKYRLCLHVDIFHQAPILTEKLTIFSTLLDLAPLPSELAAGPPKVDQPAPSAGSGGGSSGGAHDNLMREIEKGKLLPSLTPVRCLIEHRFRKDSQANFPLPSLVENVCCRFQAKAIGRSSTRTTNQYE